MYSILAAIVLSMLIGIALGAWLLSCSINYLMSRGVVDIFYNGERAEVFRMW
jgi:hypothetical protein